MYLTISPSITNWSTSGDEFSLVFDSNPLTEFVELPDSHNTLKYCSIIPGIIRGALEMVLLHWDVVANRRVVESGRSFRQSIA